MSSRLPVFLSSSLDLLFLPSSAPCPFASPPRANLHEVTSRFRHRDSRWSPVSRAIPLAMQSLTRLPYNYQTFLANPIVRIPSPCHFSTLSPRHPISFLPRLRNPGRLVSPEDASSAVPASICSDNLLRSSKHAEEIHTYIVVGGIFPSLRHSFSFYFRGGLDIRRSC